MLFGIGPNVSDSSIGFCSGNNTSNNKISQSRSQFCPLQPELSCALVEQGVIPFLRCAISGYSINDSVLKVKSAIQSFSSSSSFPELDIRRRIQLLLVKATFSCESSLQVRQRIVQSLVYSGNTKLRLNIFTSVVVLCNSSAALGRLLLLLNLTFLNFFSDYFSQLNNLLFLVLRCGLMIGGNLIFCCRFYFSCPKMVI
jgi:hypothetical protein